MELFILQYGKGPDIELIEEAIAKKKNRLPEEAFKKFQKRYSLPFWLHLATSLHSMNQQVIYPLAMWMLLEEYRGLSRLGRVLANYVGLAPAAKTFDNIHEKLSKQAANEISTIASTGRCITCFDNYTHQYGSPSLRTDRSTQYFLPTFTVGAIVQWPDFVNIDLSFCKSNVAKIYLASVPSSMKDLAHYEATVF
jgi:hypothetical protein